MSRFERFALFGALALALLLAFRGGITSSASARSPADEVPRIAVCSVVKITDELMDTDRFKPERVEFEDDLRKKQLEPILEEMKGIREKVEGMKPDEPEFNDLRERFRRLQSEAQRNSSEIMQKVEAKVAEQITQCYQLVRASTVAVAEDQGFNYVLSSGDPEDKIKTESVMKLVRDLLSRPVLLAPKGTDITEDVRKDLKLE